MHIWHAKAVAHGINRINLRCDIIVPDNVLHRAISRFPRHDKNGDALVNAIFDEAFFRCQIENVEAVYPWRKNNQRRCQHVRGRRVILDQLIQRRLMDDFTRRCRDVFAQLEGRGISMRQLTALQICHQVLHARHQACAVGLHRPL